MSKKKQSIEEVIQESEAETSVYAEPLVSLEQAALSLKMTPAFKPQHLMSVLTFCKSSGLPEFGTMEEMKQVLQKFGYKI